MKIIESIKLDLEKAAEERHKMATFHSLVLLHADSLVDFDPSMFCRDVGVPTSYQAEFRKMIATARTLSELGYSIQKK
jgi:hypothetical protein